jgi:hypothetical protein
LNVKYAGKKMKPLICVTWQTAPIIPTTNLDIWKFFFKFAYRNNTTEPRAENTKPNEYLPKQHPYE